MSYCAGWAAEHGVVKVSHPFTLIPANMSRDGLEQKPLEWIERPLVPVGLGSKATLSESNKLRGVQVPALAMAASITKREDTILEIFKHSRYGPLLVVAAIVVVLIALSRISTSLRNRGKDVDQ